VPNCQADKASSARDRLRAGLLQRCAQSSQSSATVVAPAPARPVPQVGAKRAQPSSRGAERGSARGKRSCAVGAQALARKNKAKTLGAAAAIPREAELGPLALAMSNGEDTDAKSEMLSLAVTPDMLSEVESDTPGSCADDLWGFGLEHPGHGKEEEEADEELAVLDADGAALIDSWCC
jgi:hypothetical protein